MKIKQKYDRRITINRTNLRDRQLVELKHISRLFPKKFEGSSRYKKKNELYFFMSRKLKPNENLVLKFDVSPKRYIRERSYWNSVKWNSKVSLRSLELNAEMLINLNREKYEKYFKGCKTKTDYIHAHARCDVEAYPERRPKLMTKEFPDNVKKSMGELAKNHDREYSLMVDFEKPLKQPQRIIVIEGGEHQTLRFPDFEMFGHSHPDQLNPMPSLADLTGMELNKPEFIVGGKTGRTIILNVENEKKWLDWTTRQWKKKEDTYSYFLRKYDKIMRLSRKEDRELFFKDTGVRVYPYKKGTKIEMLNDPKYEKKVPTVSGKYLKKWRNK